MDTAARTTSAVASLLSSIESFSKTTRRPLRPYQAECATAVLKSVLQRQGKIITIMFARQMGKNETSAQIEAYLLALYARRGGMIVKAAPSFKPQIVNSILRLKSTLDESALTKERWRPSFGYMLSLGKATTTFLSANEKANVVGATASLLLEIDEAQDVSPEKYARDFRPMASSTNATTVLYGTAWSEDSLLHRQKILNLEHEAQTGERLHFEYDWTHLAAINDAYGAFVGAEIARLGGDHPSIQTQYLLRSLADAGRLFSMEQRARLRGTHSRELSPDGDATYVMGIDIAGEDENAEDAVARALVPKRDSTVITIAALSRDSSGNAIASVVEHIWWTGRDHRTQYESLVALIGVWRPQKIGVDATGMGSATASFLAARFGERVREFVFTSTSKSQLAYDMLAMVNTERLTLYRNDYSAEHKQCWWEIEHCRYRLRTNDTMQWGVPPHEGHDDFVVSLALVARAAESSYAPAHSGLVRSRPTNDDDGRW